MCSRGPSCHVPVVLRWCRYSPLRPVVTCLCLCPPLVSLCSAPSVVTCWVRSYCCALYCAICTALVSSHCPPLRAAVLHSPVVCCASVGVVSTVLRCGPHSPAGCAQLNLPVLTLVWLSMAPSLAALLGWLALLGCGPWVAVLCPWALVLCFAPLLVWVWPVGGRAMPVGPLGGVTSRSAVLPTALSCLWRLSCRWRSLPCRRLVLLPRFGLAMRRFLFDLSVFFWPFWALFCAFALFWSPYVTLIARARARAQISLVPF